MLLALQRHPDTPCAAVERIEAEAATGPQGLLTLHYRLIGDLEDVALPGPALPERTDGLWRHSCFEAFIQKAGEEAYVEINLSPSAQWAAYAFDGYRRGMRAAEIGQPTLARSSAGWEAKIERTALPGGPWRVGLSAVIEERSGALSYWALAHPPGKPDFHHPDCFALELAAPGRA
jgi:hypothetical protein